MNAKSLSKRHAKPTTATLITRVDRKLNAMDGNLKRTMKTLADDFTRVLRQNDTLRGENETLREMIRRREPRSIAEANAFLASPLPPHLSITGAEALRDRIEALSPSAPSEASP